MPNGAKKPTPVTGRTPWDFAAEVSRILGPGILILTGVVYAFFQFQEQSLQFQEQNLRREEERRRATESVQQQLSKAQQQLVDTAVAVGDMNKRMAESITTRMDTLDELENRLKELQDKAEAEAGNTANAIEERRRAEEARDQVNKELEDAKAERISSQKEWTARSGSFRDKVKGLIDALPADLETSDPNLSALAEQIRRDYLVNPAALLAAVAADPNTKNLEALTELKGLTSEALMSAVEEGGDRFASWMLGKEGGRTAVLIGILEMSQHQASGVVMIEFDQGRVWSVHSGLRLVWVTFPSADDWDSEAAISITEDSQVGGVDVGRVSAELVPSLSGGQGRLSELLSDWVYTRNVVLEVLTGADPNVAAIPANELQRRAPEMYGYLQESAFEVVVAAGMLERAKTFRAAAVVDTVPMGPDLRMAVIPTLDAAVSQDSEQRRALAGEGFRPSDWGRLAAAALQDQFTVEEASVSSDGREASISCSYSRPLPIYMHPIQEAPARAPTPMLIFRKGEGPDAGRWRITSFVLLPPEAMMKSAPRAGH